MQEGKRQRQVAGIIQEELNDIFLRLELNMMEGGMVSISSVKVTPDLLEARVYLSLYKIADPGKALKKIEGRAWEIKKELSGKIKHQLRRILSIHYFIDDTLDHVFKMEALFEQIKSPRVNDDKTQPET